MPIATLLPMPEVDNSIPAVIKAAAPILFLFISGENNSMHNIGKAYKNICAGSKKNAHGL